LKDWEKGHAGTTNYYEILETSSRKSASPCSALPSAVFDKMQYDDAAASLLKSHPANSFYFKNQILQ
jgi:hypothetical protein